MSKNPSEALRSEGQGFLPLYQLPGSRFFFECIEKLGSHRSMPNGCSLASVLWGLTVLWQLSLGHWAWSAVALLGSGLCDVADGHLARKMGVNSTHGELLDTLCDRLVDSFISLGFILFFRNSTLNLGLSFLLLQGSFLMSYLSAKAEALHITAHPPLRLMKRPDRLAMLIVALLVAALLPHRFPTVTVALTMIDFFLLLSATVFFVTLWKRTGEIHETALS